MFYFIFTTLYSVLFLNYSLILYFIDVKVSVASSLFFIFFSLIPLVRIFFYKQFLNKKIKATELIKNDDFFSKTIYDIVFNICSKNGLKKFPKIYVYQEDEINAFVTGRGSSEFSIYLSSESIKRLDLKDLKCLISHELSHLINKDLFLQQYFGTFLDPLKFLLVKIFNNKEIEIISFIDLILFMPFSLYFNFMRKEFELLADKKAAEIVSSNDYLDFISRIKFYNKENKVTNTSWYQKLFKTHPSLNERFNFIKNNSLK